MLLLHPWRLFEALGRGRSSHAEQSLGTLAQEPNELDWKAGLSPKKERLIQHLSAFANYSNGGILAFGIDSERAIPVGLDQAACNDIVGQLANLARDGLEPAVVIDHAIVQSSGVDLLLIHVPESKVKPVHLRGKTVENCFIRSGGTTRKASRQEVGAMMLNSKNPRWEDLHASSLLTGEAVLDCLDVAGVHKLLDRPMPADTAENLTWLAQEKMIVPAGAGFYVTNLGAIAAARRLDEFEGLGRKGIRLVQYRGLNKVETITEQVGGKGYAVGFAGLIERLNRILPHSEVIQSALRTTVAVYPAIALRELIANALIHQDFATSGVSPMIEIFDNRIEFTNPGRLLAGKKIDRLIGTSPESRNEMLASAFRRCRICEERGTGFQKVVTAVELFGMPPIAFEEGEGYFKVTLFSPRKFSEMSNTERIEACYQHAVLKYLTSSAMTNASLRARLKMSEKQRTQVSNLISDAMNTGRIKRKDASSKSSKFAEYVPYWA